MLRIAAPATLQGEVRPPADKSLTHRAYLLGAASTGECVVANPLRGEDCENTLRCLQAMGLSAVDEKDGRRRLVPAADWYSPSQELDCGNSGTTMRLLAGMVGSRPIEAVLVGDASLSRRPMGRIAEPLRLMGASVEGDRPPLRIRGSQLRGIRYATPVASAQIKSCILLAGLRAQGETAVEEPSLSRDHTERMLEACGVTLVREGVCVSLQGGQSIAPFAFTVPGDISSAAFWLVAATIVPGSRLLLRGVGINPTRTGILEVFDQIGNPILLHDERSELGEPVADLEAAHAGTGMPFEIGGALVPRLVDEIPVLAVLATQLDGISRIRDAAELRVKESDRLETVAAGLEAMGATVRRYDDGLDIEGPTPLHAARIDARHDHRIGMAFAIAGLIARGETTIEGAESIQTSYPDFERDLHALSVW